MCLPFQSRETLSSDGEGARGDCSSVSSSGSSSEEQPPCDIGLLERLIRTHPVWFLPGIQRAGAFHLLQGKEEGVSVDYFSVLHSIYEELLHSLLPKRFEAN